MVPGPEPGVRRVNRCVGWHMLRGKLARGWAPWRAALLPTLLGSLGWRTGMRVGSARPRNSVRVAAPGQPAGATVAPTGAPVGRADPGAGEKPTGLAPGIFQPAAADRVQDLARCRRSIVAPSGPAARAGPTAATSAARRGTAARLLGSGYGNAAGADRPWKPMPAEICRNAPFSTSHSIETRNTPC